ncbi:MAG: TIGR03089 family protein [Angustibacter sp.]
MRERAPRTPSQLLRTITTTDPTRPRITWYDDLPGPTAGERIELSGRVLGTWVAKAAGLLVDELDVQHGDLVRLDLPTHWRTVYWALAAWEVGAAVELGRSPTGDPPAAVITTAPTAQSVPVVAVSRAALARAWAGSPLPPGAVDEAADLPGQPDVFEPPQPPSPGEVALRSAAGVRSAADLVDEAADLAERSGWPLGARVGLRVDGDADPAEALQVALAAWRIEGSLVLVTCRSTDPELDARWTEEQVTVLAGAP